MKKILIHNSKIILPTILAIIIASFMWNRISFEFNNPEEVIGYYSIFKHNPLNDNLRYIFFVGFPILTYLSLFIFFNKNRILNFKEIFLINNETKNSEEISKYFLFSFFIIQIFFFLSNDFNLNKIDIFHEGQALSGGLNFKLKDQLWEGSFITTSIFVDVISANLSWKLFGIQSISSYRYFIEILNLITAFSIIIFIFKLTNGSNLNKNLKTFIFIFFSFFIISLIDNNTFSYRELPLFIFLIIVYEIIKLKKFNLIHLFFLGFIPILGILWSLDRGIFIIAGYIPFIFILLINRRFIEILIIFLIAISSIIIFFIIIGDKEFFLFISNSIDILKSADLHNGIIHPTPFSNEDGSARATKNFLLMIITGIILINYIFKEKRNLNRNLIIFLSIFYFISLIFYKIGVTRSDGGHLKQGASLCSIILIYLLIYNLIYFLTNKFNLTEKKNSLFKSLNVIIFLIFILLNIPENFFKNISTYKKRLTEYNLMRDDFYLTDKERSLINQLRELTNYEKCFQVFSYETAITYYLNKPSCTKFHHIFNLGPKKNQFLFIEQLKKTKPKFILIGGNYEKIGNMKGRNNIELSAKDRFPYINQFIIENYKIFKEIDKWKILIKI